MHQLVHFFVFDKINLFIFAITKDKLTLYTGILIDLSMIIKF
jgi:hypothetical protein